MNTQMIICMVIFAATLVSYMLNKIPMWLTAMLSLAALYFTGCTDAEGALAGFSNANTLLMATMFVLAAGFRRTSLVDGMCDAVMKLTRGSFKTAYFGYILIAVLLGLFVVPALEADHVERFLQALDLGLHPLGLLHKECVPLRVRLAPLRAPGHKLLDLLDLQPRALEALDHAQRLELLLAEAADARRARERRKQALLIIIPQRRDWQIKPLRHLTDRIHGITSKKITKKCLT